jgi:hypothetical protein
MIAYLVRFVKRVGVLIPGLVVTYVAVGDVFPPLRRLLHDRSLAILATYIIIAYVLIPALLRLIRIVIKPRHIPLYCITPDGFASDPVNIGIVGNRKQVIRAMQRAGWYLADRRTLRNMFRLGVSTVLRQRYATAPFSNLYLFGRSQDFGFELPLDDNPTHRHHVRFWAANDTGKPEHSAHVTFWQRIHRSTATSGRVLWVGAASLDTGVGIIRHNAQLTHMIHPDTNAERELIAQNLKATGLVKKSRKISIGSPYRLRNRTLNGYMKADGKMTICEL